MRALLLLSFVFSVQAKSKAEKAAAIDAAHDMVNKIEKLCRSSKSLATNTTAMKPIQKDLDAAAARVASDFKARRAGLEADFSKVEGNAAGNPNLTAELLAINHKLDALDVAQRHAVSKALGDVIDAGDKALKEEKKAAHKAIHPLYGMGDSTEKFADKFSDALTDAVNCVQHANLKLAKHLGDYADKIEHEAKELLKQDADAREAAVKHVTASRGAAVSSFAAQPAGGSSVAQARGISSVLIACLFFGAIIMSFIKKVRDRHVRDHVRHVAAVAEGLLPEGTTTPLLHV